MDHQDALHDTLLSEQINFEAMDCLVLESGMSMVTGSAGK